jgi:hypothetical protein
METKKHGFLESVDHLDGKTHLKDQDIDGRVKWI